MSTPVSGRFWCSHWLTHKLHGMAMRFDCKGWQPAAVGRSAAACLVPPQELEAVSVSFAATSVARPAAPVLARALPGVCSQVLAQRDRSMLSPAYWRMELRSLITSAAHAHSCSLRCPAGWQH